MKESADHVYNLFSPRFWLGQLDLRPLGFFRIAWGLALLFSISDISTVLFDFLSDGGVAPRAALWASLVRTNRVSIYDLAGPPWVLVTLYVLTLLSIVVLVVGWHTRIASVTTFILVCGLHERNLLIFDGSDNVLRVLLFWLMFMPAGARYSVDALVRKAKGLPPLTHAPALPMRLGQVQIAWIYLNTTIHKWPGAEWHNGTALRIALGLNHGFVRDLGRWVFTQQWLTVLGTHFTIVAEVAILPLIFLPVWRPTSGPLAKWPAWVFQPTYKAIAILMGVGLHLGIALMMSVGHFSYIMMTSYFLLFEPEWIEAIVRFLRPQLARGLQTVTRLLAPRSEPVGAPTGLATQAALATGGGLGAARATFAAPFAYLATELSAPRASGGAELRRPAGSPSGSKGQAAQVTAELPSFWTFAIPVEVRDFLRGVLHFALAFLMATCMWFSLPDKAIIPPLTIKGQAWTGVIDVSPSQMWQPLFRFIQESELWQKWDMFSPKPLDTDRYLMGRGELTDGTQVDVLRGDRGDGRGPLLPPVEPSWIFTRWTKYLDNIHGEPDNSPWTLEFGRFICRRWNFDAPKGRAALKTFKLYREYQKVPLFGETPDPWKEVMIWDHHCF